MRRREWLTICGTLSAGCLSGPDPGRGMGGTPIRTGTQTPIEDTPTVAMGETVTTDAGTEVTVADPAVSMFVISVHAGTSTVHPDVGGDPDAQFLRISVQASGGGTATPPSRYESIRSTVDGRVLGNVRPFQLENGADRYALSVPVDDYDSAGVVWHHEGDRKAMWRLGADTIELLASAPSFAVRRFEAPETVQRGESIEATLTVANTGARDGTFVAEFGDFTLISDVGEETVDVIAGGETTRSLTYDPPYWRDVSEIQLTLDWGSDQASRTVTVED